MHQGGDEGGIRRRIVIVGGGTAGWMAAAALARFLERGWAITLVESEAIGTVGVGEATIPQIRLFNASLGLDEDAFVAATQGTFKLGIEFAGWGAGGERYMHGFGAVGRPLGLIPFHHYWLATGGAAAAGALGAHCPNVVAAWANRFGRTDPATASPLRPYLPWAFHFDAALYAAFLRRRAEACGVVRREGRILAVERAGETGDVAGVRLESGEVVAGDLFLDCSGFGALLLGGTLDVPFEDWSGWLPCDRAWAVPCVRAEPLIPYTRATARAAGWQWRIGLQHRTGNGIVFASAAMAEEEAHALLLANLDGAPLAEPRLLRFTAGRRRAAWAHNVVSVGLASGFLEPLESTSIHLVQSAIERILDFLPDGRPDARAVAAYNRLTAREMERVRDFIILHYWANRRPEPFWRDRAAMALPDALAARIELWREAGRLVVDADELFTEAAWVQVLVGQGIVPERWHPLADQLSADQRAGFMAAQRQVGAARAEALPDHDAFIRRHCAAPSVGQVA